MHRSAVLVTRRAVVTRAAALTPVWEGKQSAQDAMRAVEAACNAVLQEPCG